MEDYDLDLNAWSGTAVNYTEQDALDFINQLNSTPLPTTTDPSAAFTDPNHVPWFLLPSSSSSQATPYPNSQSAVSLPTAFSVHNPAPPPFAPGAGNVSLTSGSGGKETSGKDKEGSTSRMKSCAACRIRRVKCERDAGESDCQKCKEKSLVCTPMPSVPRKTQVRTGRRIQQAQALFGSGPVSQPSPDTTFVSSNKRARSTSSSEDSLIGRSAELSPSSVVGKLITTELEGVLSASLLDLYLALPRSRIPLLEEGTSFRNTFQAANRRLIELDSHNQVLLSVILALSARVSDHPLLVGANPPTLRQLNDAVLNSQDLSEWGKRREEACAVLTQKAVKLADEKAIWREASVSNMATLLMLEGLVDTNNSTSDNDSSPYADAYVRHLRELLQRDTTGKLTESLLSSGLGWVCYMRDATRSAHVGRNSIISYEEFELYFLGGLWSKVPPLSALLQTADYDSANEQGEDGPWKAPFWNLFRGFMIHLANISRDFPDRLTGVGARRRPLREDLIRDLIERIDLASTAAVILERRGMNFLGNPQTCCDDYKSTWNFVRVLRLYRCGLTIFLNRTLQQRLQARPVPRFEEIGRLQNPEEETSDDKYWKMMDKLHDDTTSRAFLAARESVAMLRVNLQNGLWFGIFSGAQGLFVKMPIWVTYILNASTKEEGGPYANFTFEAKLDDLRCILQALVSIGWAFERLARPVPWIRQEIQALELRQALYHQQNYSNPADAFAYLNSSNDYGLNSSSDGQLSSEDINRLLNEMGAEEDEGNFGDFGTSPMGAGTRVPFDQLRGVKGPESEEALTLRMLSSLLG